MKFQDIIFLFVLVFLLYRRNSVWTAAAGIICLVISIPLFAKWIFFTAERLTWYGAGFFLLAILIQKFSFKKIKK